MRLLKNGIKRMKTLVTYTSNQGVSDDDGVVELCDYLTKNPTMRVIANVRKNNNDRIAYEFSAIINGPLVIITNSIGDAFYKNGSTYIVTTIDTLQVDTSSGKEVVLWENASPTSAFSSQDISINTSKYKYIKVYFKITSANSTEYYLHVYDTNVESGGICLTSVSSLGYRAVTNSLTKVTFTAGYYYSLDTTSFTINDSVLIPIKIIGVY